MGLTFELTDASKKGQLFQLTMFSPDTADYFPLDFYTYSGRMICDSDYSSKHYSYYEEYAFDSSTSTIVGFDLSFTGPQLSLTNGAEYDKGESSNNKVGVQQGMETEDGQSNHISGKKTDTLGTLDTTKRNLRREIGTE